MSILKDQINILIKDGLSYFNIVTQPDIENIRQIVPSDSLKTLTPTPASASSSIFKTIVFNNEIEFNIFKLTRLFLKLVNQDTSSITENGTVRFNKSEVLKLLNNKAVLISFSSRIFGIFKNNFDKLNIVSDDEIRRKFVSAILEVIETNNLWKQENTDVVEQIIKYNLKGSNYLNIENVDRLIREDVEVTINFKDKTEKVVNPDLEQILETFFEVVYDFYKDRISRDFLNNLPEYEYLDNE